MVVGSRLGGRQPPGHAMQRVWLISSSYSRNYNGMDTLVCQSIMNTGGRGRQGLHHGRVGRS